MSKHNEPAAVQPRAQYRISGGGHRTRWYDDPDAAWEVYCRAVARQCHYPLHRPGRVCGDGHSTRADGTSYVIGARNGLGWVTMDIR